MRFDYEVDTRLRYRDDDYVRRYDRSAHGFTITGLRSSLVAWHEKRLVRKALTRITVRPRRVADIPCGTGKLSGVLGQTTAAIVGGDISAEMMSVAREHYAAVPAFRGFVRFDLTASPFADSSFDCVISLRLLHRVPPDIRRGIIAELARISARHVVVSYGVTNRRERVRDTIRRVFVDTEPYRQLAVPATVVARELAEAGLRIIASHPVLWGLSREIIVLAAKAR